MSRSGRTVSGRKPHMLGGDFGVLSAGNFVRPSTLPPTLDQGSYQPTGVRMQAPRPASRCKPMAPAPGYEAR
jgi:hypothetical protein